MEAYESIISIQDYHSDIAIPSKTGLSMLLDRPSRYWKHFLAPPELRESFEPSKAQREGDAVHVLTLEPDTWDSRYLIVPVQARTTKAFQGAKKDNPHKVCLTMPEYDHIRRMSDALLDDPKARMYLDLAGEAEKTFYYRDPKTGIDLKARPDFISSDSIYVVDIKTTKDITAYKFLKDSDNYKYWLSPELIFNAVEACRGIRPKAYVFLCVENTGDKVPDTDVFFADPDFLDIGQLKLEEALEILKKCRETGIWPASSDKPTSLGLTSYRMKELERLREQRAAKFLEEYNYAG